MESRSKVIVILGPTASGKSDVAIQLARKFNGEVISADSRQVYRGMDIGTGKVTKREQRLAKHWMLNVASPNTDYNVAKFKRDAQKAMANILDRGKLPIICGGTGFWIDALVHDQVFPEVKPNIELRNSLRNETPEQLFKSLQKIDPERARSIDARNPVRLIRAIEICDAIGKVPTIRRRASGNGHQFLMIGIDVPKEKLHRNIENRLDARLKQGMVDETKQLHEKYRVSWKRLEAFGLEYRWTAKYLQEKITGDEMRLGLLRDIKHYAKRQMTWFRRDKNIVWMNNASEISARVKAFVK